MEDKIRLHLKSYRAAQGKTQREMAQIIGVSYRTYQEMESDGVVKKLESLTKLKEKTGFDSTQDYTYNFKKSVDVADVQGLAIEMLIRIESKVNVMFSNEAEKTAIATGRKPTDVLREMNAAARLEADNLQEELKRKPK